MDGTLGMTSLVERLAREAAGEIEKQLNTLWMPERKLTAQTCIAAAVRAALREAAGVARKKACGDCWQRVVKAIEALAE